MARHLVAVKDGQCASEHCAKERAKEAKRLKADPKTYFDIKAGETMISYYGPGKAYHVVCPNDPRVTGDPKTGVRFYDASKFRGKCEACGNWFDAGTSIAWRPALPEDNAGKRRSITYHRACYDDQFGGA